MCDEEDYCSWHCCCKVLLGGKRPFFQQYLQQVKRIKRNIDQDNQEDKQEEEQELQNQDKCQSDPLNATVEIIPIPQELENVATSPTKKNFSDGDVYKVSMVIPALPSLSSSASTISTNTAPRNVAKVILKSNGGEKPEKRESQELPKEVAISENNEKIQIPAEESTVLQVVVEPSTADVNTEIAEEKNVEKPESISTPPVEESLQQPEEDKIAVSAVDSNKSEGIIQSTSSVDQILPAPPKSMKSSKPEEEKTAAVTMDNNKPEGITPSKRRLSKSSTEKVLATSTPPPKSKQEDKTVDKSKSEGNYNYRNRSEFHTCTHCSKKFGSASSLKWHEKEHRLEAAKHYECIDCGKSYTTAASYDRHLKAHPKCLLCSRRMTVKEMESQPEGDGVNVNVCNKCRAEDSPIIYRRTSSAEERTSTPENVKMKL